MELGWLVDAVGESGAAVLGGLLIGVLFGASAQRSRFCLRSAVIEFARGQFAAKLSIWLLAFSAAVLATQALIVTGALSVADARQLTGAGSVSGAAVGGALFGVGMILARGCSSRLLVLSANGNLRALLSGLIFAVTAQASLRGMLSPLREGIAGLWTVSGDEVLNLIAVLHLAGPLGDRAGLWLGGAFMVVAILFARRSGLTPTGWTGGVGVGLAVAFGWLFTDSLAKASFGIVPVESMTFTGPSADMLMLVLNPPGAAMDFDSGLLPGVFLGSFLAALWARELKLEGFEGGASMRRYIAGAVLMGFGGMLAGGCAVGSGVSGGAIFALTAWITLSTMWAGAAITDWLVDRRPAATVTVVPSVPAGSRAA